jgi:electron transfer flavoprotein alpha subunit
VILVVAEQKDGVLNRASWEAVAAAQQMGGPAKVVVPGAGVTAAAAELADADVAEVIALQHDALGTYTADGFVQALAALIAAESPHIVFSTPIRRATTHPNCRRLDRAIATDCTA